jgi:GR25 family glycosyltransferase involved in LPS biosynthesis
MFDAVFCINLDRRPERWEKFQRRIPAEWPFGIGCPVERWSAVDGRVASMPSWFRGPAGACGCYLSHRAIWQHQIEAGLDSVLILEDDAVFAHNAVATMLETLEVVPDWDQIYFGGQHLDTNDRPPVSEIPQKLIRCRNVNRTHAYAITREFAEIALNYMDGEWSPDPRVHHVDYRLAELHDLHRVYAPWRFCVGQARDVSDVRTSRRRPAAVCEHWWNTAPIVDPVTAGCV